MKSVVDHDTTGPAVWSGWPGRAASAGVASWPDEVRTLRRELADLAFDYERQGRPDAADVAVWVGRRLADLEDRACGSPA